MCKSPVPHSSCLATAGSSSSKAYRESARLQAELVLDGLGDAVIDMPSPAAQIAPRADQFDRALLERAAAVGNQTIRIEAVDLAQAVARQAHALRAVEAEQLRAGRLEADAAMRAGIMGREINVVGRAVPAQSAPISSCGAALRGGACRTSDVFARARRCGFCRAIDGHDQVALADLERQLDGFGQARPRPSGAAISRSITTSMLCRIWRSSRRSSSSDTTRPSTRARTKPCFNRSTNRSRYSPFWPRISGASTENFVPCGSVPMRADDLLARLGRDRPRAFAGNAPGRCGHRARAGNRRSR